MPRMAFSIRVTRDARSSTLAACRMSLNLLHNSMRTAARNTTWAQARKQK
jgi:hypothetical protein